MGRYVSVSDSTDVQRLEAEDQAWVSQLSAKGPVDAFLVSIHRKPVAVLHS